MVTVCVVGGRRNHLIVHPVPFLLSYGSIFAQTKFWLFSLNGSSSKWMVTVCVGGGRRTICNGFPLPTKCTMIKLFPFFSFGYFGIFQESWCLSLNMAILLSLPANKMHNDRLVSFFFSLGCFL